MGCNFKRADRGKSCPEGDVCVIYCSGEEEPVQAVRKRVLRVVPEGDHLFRAVFLVILVRQAVRPDLVPLTIMVVPRQPASDQAWKTYHQQIERTQDAALQGMSEFVGDDRGDLTHGGVPAHIYESTQRNTPQVWKSVRFADHGSSRIRKNLRTPFPEQRKDPAENVLREFPNKSGD